MVQDSYYDVMSRFRDRILRLTQVNPVPDRDCCGLMIHVGKIQAGTVDAIRRQVVPGTFLLICHPAADSGLAESCAAALPREEATLFCPLTAEAFYADKAGMSLNLLTNRKVAFSIPDKGEAEYGNELRAIRHALDMAIGNTSLSFYSRLMFLRNALFNLPLIFGVSRCAPPPLPPDVPVVLCGAGPSLRDDLPVLRKYGEKVLIGAVYRALPRLEEAGIRADFAIQIDASDVMSASLAAPPPLVAMTSLSTNIASQFGEIVWVRGCLPEFDRMLEESGVNLMPLVRSITVMVTSMDFARNSGARHVALIGSDLCLSGDRSYYGGASGKALNENELIVPAKGGGTVVTTPNLESMRRAVADYLDGIPDAASMFWNCSSRGAALGNCTEGALEEFCQRFANITKPELRIIHDALPQLGSKLEILDEKLRRFGECCAVTAQSAAKMKRELESDSPELDQLNCQRAILGESEKEKKHLLDEPLLRCMHSVFKAQADELLFHAGLGFDPAAAAPRLLAAMARENELLSSMSADFLADLDTMLGRRSDRNSRRRDFKTLTRLAADFVGIHNPPLASFLRMKEVDGVIISSYNYLNLPSGIRLPDGREASRGDGNSIQASTLERMRGFLREAPETGAAVFVSAGNLYPVIAMARLRPRLPLLILMPQAYVLAEIAAISFFTHELNPESRLICTDVNPDWEEICESVLAQWERDQRQVALFRCYPHDFPEAGLLAETLEKKAPRPFIKDAETDK